MEIETIVKNLKGRSPKESEIVLKEAGYSKEDIDKVLSHMEKCKAKKLFGLEIK